MPHHVCLCTCLGLTFSTMDGGTGVQPWQNSSLGWERLGPLHDTATLKIGQKRIKSTKTYPIFGVYGVFCTILLWGRVPIL